MKALQDMSLEELWQLFPIILKEYNPYYPMWYEDEKNNIYEILDGCAICRINHIGSTFVEGLISKPIIDILLELPVDYDIDIIIDKLQSVDWLVMAKNSGKKTIDLNKGYTLDGFAEKVFHLHIKPYGDWNELYFRDYLKAHADIAKQYEILKISLKDKYKHDRDAYTEAKSEFILKQNDKARAEFGDRYLPL